MRIARKDAHHLIRSVEHDVDDKVDREKVSEFINILTHRIANANAQLCRRIAQHRVVCSNGLATCEADERALTAAGVADKLMRVYHADDDARIRLSKRPIDDHRRAAARLTQANKLRRIVVNVGEYAVASGNVSANELREFIRRRRAVVAGANDDKDVLDANASCVKLGQQRRQ